MGIHARQSKQYTIYILGRSREHQAPVAADPDPDPEGYHKDGSFAYQGIYMSNAHGWSTGPAAALSAHVVGIRPITAGGASYLIHPSVGDLSHCEGSRQFTPGHRVAVQWKVGAVYLFDSYA